MWATRKVLRERELIPNWSSFGVPFLMVAPLLYMGIIIGLPMLFCFLFVWAITGLFWAIVATVLSYFVFHFLQFMFLQ